MVINADVSTDISSEVPRKVRRGIRRGMAEAANAGFAVSQDEAPADTGNLLQSGFPPTFRGNDIVWGYSTSYAEFVENGTPPHYPPIEPLKGWARRVLGNEQAAWAIQEKIAQEGTEPQPYVEPGVEEMMTQLESRGLSPYIDDEL